MNYFLSGAKHVHNKVGTCHLFVFMVRVSPNSGKNVHVLINSRIWLNRKILK